MLAAGLVVVEVYLLLETCGWVCTQVCGLFLCYFLGRWELRLLFNLLGLHDSKALGILRSGCAVLLRHGLNCLNVLLRIHVVG